MADAPPLLELRGITKRFGSLVANSAVDLDVRAGEVHALLGENGAGKSTLMNVLYGLYSADSGEILLEGKPLRLHSPRDAIDAGIGMVHQHFMLIPVMTVAENIVLAHEPHRGVLMDYPKARQEVRELSSRYGLAVSPDDRVEEIGVAQQQRVEILKALFRSARVLILDEPTAALGVKQSGVVLKYTAAARDAGLGVVFITHNPHHAYLVGNHFIILKLGQAVLDKKRSEVSLDELTRQMAGGDELTELSHELQR
jgi:ABC-type uncharacterized transport system ATPase subunit